MKKRHHDDADVFDERGVVRDGARLRVPMFSMDGFGPLQRSVAQSSVRIVDGQGGAAGLNKPGWRLPVSDAAWRDAREAAYRDYDAALVNAYRDVTRKRNEPDDDEDEEQEIAQGSDSRTVDAIARDHRQRMDNEYRRYDERLRNAYRGQR
jgi:hypothetical protein